MAVFDCSFDPHPTFYIYTMYIIGMIVLPFNMFGTYCVVKKTPAHLADYKRTLLYYQLCVSISDFFIAFVFTPVLFVPFPIHYSAGITSLFSFEPIICLVGCMFCLLQSFSATLHLFHYRLMVILPPNSIFRWQRPTTFCFRVFSSVLVVSPIVIIPITYQHTDLTVYGATIRQQYQCVDHVMSHSRARVSDPSLNRLVHLYIGGMGVTLWFVSACMAFTTYWIMRRMKAISEKTHHLQQKFQLVLMIQAVFPIIVIGIPGWIMIGLYATDRFAPQWLGLLFMLSLSIHGFVGNVIMVLFNSDYYRFAKKSLSSLTKWKINDSSSNNSE
ncbi:unnamed protein product [Auanema sp. JU1783]|nr:unnamed protein product [Auanema sp. JU1783]